jgi:hypothetical protein
MRHFVVCARPETRASALSAKSARFARGPRLALGLGPMPTRKKADAPPAYVTIVSTNPETLDGLQQYLARAGIPSRTTRVVLDLTIVAPDHATAIVIFPDDFAEDAVLALVAVLRRKRARLLILLITRAPNRFRSALSADDEHLPMPTILVKPLFGWLILDAIRGQAASEHA